MINSDGAERETPVSTGSKKGKGEQLGTGQSVTTHFYNTKGPSTQTEKAVLEGRSGFIVLE